MKHTVRFKITLWYTLVMLLISVGVLAVITAVSKSAMMWELERKTERSVTEFAHRAEGPEGVDRIPPFGFFEQGVQLTVLREDGELIAGTPPVALDSTPLEDGTLRTVSTEAGEFLVQTRRIMFRDKSFGWVQGFASVSDQMLALRSAMRTNLLLTLIFIILAAFGGYFIMGKSLSPVRKISRTAREITESQDLSRRIHIGKGQDEFHTLANLFDRMLDQIEETVEREKQFTSDASHELRTPVAVILSECEYMTDCAKTAEELTESAAAVKVQAQKMSHLISQLLTLSRMDRNTLQTAFESVDFSELLEFVCDEQEEIQSGSSIALTRSIPPGIPVRGDRGLLARLCINLIANAYRYGKENITVSLAEDDQTVTLRVQDDGIGIAPEHLAKIWDRFYQVDPSRSANQDGSLGLGLSMVRWIAQCHGGRTEVESVPGEGSVFTVVLPKAGQ